MAEQDGGWDAQEFSGKLHYSSFYDDISVQVLHKGPGIHGASYGYHSVYLQSPGLCREELRYAGCHSFGSYPGAFHRLCYSLYRKGQRNIYPRWYLGKDGR